MSARSLLCEYWVIHSPPSGCVPQEHLGGINKDLHSVQRIFINYTIINEQRFDNKTCIYTDGDIIGSGLGLSQ